MSATFDFLDHYLEVYSFTIAAFIYFLIDDIILYIWGLTPVFVVDI